ncbi:MAG TPA: glycosyltransferase family 2 protein [Cytophagaceae bacterium]|jgi:glycosyltransferase involved in cell wall biosynthesis|nr:glycosyltransferase family 2 protein [Cytophagaceae bacterium]
MIFFYQLFSNWYSRYNERTCSYYTNDMQKQGGRRLSGKDHQKEQPVVSIITIVYNGGKLLEGTIQSIVKQDSARIEYIVIDGGSKDETLDLIRKYDDQIDYWISEPDKGIYDAMNKGLKAATGEYVWFMNAGDQVHGEHVLEAIFSKDKEADVYYGETNLVNENRKVLGTRSERSTRQLPDALTYHDMLYGMVVCHQSFIARRSLVGPYDTNYRCSADIDWVIEVLKKSTKIVNTQCILSDYLVGGFSIQQQKLAWKERFQIYNHHFGIVKNSWATIYIVFRQLIHRLRGKGNY